MQAIILNIKMNLSIYMVLKICFIITITAGISLRAEDYVHLITDVYKISKSSSVSLLHFTDEENLSQKNLIFNIQVKLYKDRIMSTTINMENVLSLPPERLAKFEGLSKNAKAMSVFFLTSTERDLNKMKKALQPLSRKDTTNLVVFVKTDGTPLLEFCMKPDGNPFLLWEGVSLLVKCYEDTAIREWNSLNQTQMRVYERATWEPKTGLVLKSEKLVLSDRDVPNGKVLRTGAVDSRDGALLKPFEEELFRTIKLIGKVTMQLNSKDNADHESLHFLRSNFLDTLKFVDSEDFIKVVGNFEYVLLIKEPKNEMPILWTVYFQPFTIVVWVALVLSFAVIQAIRLIMKTKLQTNLHGTFVGDDFLYVCGIYCQQGLPEFPRPSSLRIFYCSIFFFAFSIFSIYSAGFVTELTTSGKNLPFKSLSEFANVKSHKLIVTKCKEEYEMILTSKNPVLREAGNLLMKWNELPVDVPEALDMPQKTQKQWHITAYGIKTASRRNKITRTHCI